MRILVTGSKDWLSESVIRTALIAVIDMISDSDEAVTIVHGDCPSGADAMADRIARSMGWTVEPHPAEWIVGGKLDKRAGYRRNAEMVALGADVCTAFIRDNSPGASHASGLAEKAGIPTYVWTVNT